MVPCSRELLVRLWLDTDVSVPLVFLLCVIWGGRCSKAEAPNTSSCLSTTVQSEPSSMGEDIMSFQLGN